MLQDIRALVGASRFFWSGRAMAKVVMPATTLPAIDRQIMNSTRRASGDFTGSVIIKILHIIESLISCVCNGHIYATGHTKKHRNDPPVSRQQAMKKK